MIELGGNINLENFENIDQGQLIVIRKVVGNYTKNISKKYKDFKKITVCIIPETKFKIKVNLETQKTIEKEAENPNLFFAMDQALAKFLKD
jgi:ribosome-associated translation inhibitor RaiA|tara:strand:+ start:302 stop:574 length:273 start_codon:yes stop_codon:yes gene_type:complete